MPERKSVSVWTFVTGLTVTVAFIVATNLAHRALSTRWPGLADVTLVYNLSAAEALAGLIGLLVALTLGFAVLFLRRLS